MPAPPTELVTALREGLVFRHLFFRMDHSQGAVLAWDGIGEIEFNSEIYKGVGDFGEVGGVSNSGDIQNHLLELTLNAVPYDVLRTTDPIIDGNAAKLSAVWLTESGGIVASRTLFAGKGSFLRLKTGEETATLRAYLRGPAFDWASVPRSYYSNADQTRLYSGDSGCSQVAGLENAVFAGWQDVADGGGGGAFAFVPAENAERLLRSSDNQVIGHHAWGPFFQQINGLLYTASNQISIVERTTLANVIHAGGGQPITIDGQQVLFDGSGFLVSSDGLRLGSSNNPASDLTALRVLASSGATAGLRLRSYGAGSARSIGAGLASGASLTAPDFSRRVFDEQDPGEVVLRPDPDDQNPTTDFYDVINSRTGRRYMLAGTVSKIGASVSAGGNPNTAELFVIGSTPLNYLQTVSTGLITDSNSGLNVIQEGLTSADSLLRVWA